MIKTRLKTKDVYVDICGTRYFKSRKDGNADFTTRLVSKGGVYSWYEGSKVDNALLLDTQTLYALSCTCEANTNCKVDMVLELFRTGILDVKIPESSCSKKRRTTENEQKHQCENVAREAANDIRESRKPFEDAIAKKRKLRNKLGLLDNYCNAFSGDHIILKKCL